MPAAVWLAWLLTLPPRPSQWIVVLSGLPLLALGSWLISRHAGVPWRAAVAATAGEHALAVLLLFALGVQFEDAHGVTTDGAIYFSQLRSVIFDRDLDLAAEFAFLGQPSRPSHVVPIGPIGVWLPLYLLVAAADWAGRTVGWWAGPSEPGGLGLTTSYVRAALVSSFAIGGAGLVVLHRYLKQEFGARAALLCTLLVFGATPLAWYMVYEPAMTHAASFGFIALFVVAATRRTAIGMHPRDGVVLGALLGLAFVSRPQEALFALLPAILILTSPAPAPVRLRAASRLAWWGLIGAAPFLVAQAIHSYVLISHSQFVLVGSGDASGYLNPLQSRWADVLWSSWHGFLSWSPVAYVALIGTAAYVRRNWRWGVAALLIVLLMAWVNGSTTDWAAGWSFGGRRFVSVLVIIAPGLALVLDALIRRPMIAIAALAIAAVAWNQLLLAQLRLGMLPAGGPVSFAQVVRQQGSVLTRPPFFYPFAFPANVLFAWRYDLPIDRYDLLAPEQPRGTFATDFEGRAARFLFGGWGAPGGDDFGSLYWMDGERAELVVPFDPTDRERVMLTFVARTRLVDPPVSVSVDVFVNGQRVGSLTPPSAIAAPSTLDLDARAFRRGFNRIALQKPPRTPSIGFYKLDLK